ncbi:MAG: outer membrane protein assembly factor BamB [Pseudomonadota bacterium]
MRSLRWLLVLGALVLSGCGIFGGDDDELPPAPLVVVDDPVKTRKVLSVNLGGGSERLRLALAPSGDGTRVFAASADGKVHAFDNETHRRQWQANLKRELTAGPGVGDGRLVVADRNGSVIALDARTGEQLWQRDIAAEVLAPPVLGADRVFLRTVDGRLLALDANSGSTLWFVEQPVPVLSQRGLGKPAIVGSLVVAGFDNGRVVAVNILSGDIEWEVPLGIPSGRTDIDRMVDTDGVFATSGTDLYVSGFSSRTASMAIESGQAMWAREYSTSTGVSLDWANLYMCNADNRVMAISRRNGALEWTSDDFVRRSLSAPAVWGDLLAFGDFEGYVHLLNARTGDHAGRLRVDGAAVVVPPYVMGDTLYVQSESGALAGFELRESR